VLKPCAAPASTAGTALGGRFLGQATAKRHGSARRKADCSGHPGTKIVPKSAKGGRSARGKRTTLFMRFQGHEWSDGSPVTAMTSVFWFEDVYRHKD